MSSGNDWAQFYQQHNLNTTQGSVSGSSNMISSVADATVMTTNPGANSAVGAQLSPEGRVSKPTRRRRASRAAPTTLLNTDTTNFRAMVQQFTGVPNAPFSFGSHTNSSNQSFGVTGHPNATSATAMPRGYYNNDLQHQRQQQQQQQQQQYMFSLNGNNEGYVSGFNNIPRPDLEDSDGLFMNNIYQRSSSSNDNRRNGYGM